MSIYVVMHKVVDICKMQEFIPLLVGAKEYKGNIPNEILKDDSIEDNISNKNKNYCELTGLYWMWKNSKIDENEIIGLCHYRRYFLKNMFKVGRGNYLNHKEIENIMKNYDIILPKKRTYKIKNIDNFQNAPKTEDLEKTREVIEKLYPEYLDSFDQSMNSNKIYLYNMFVTKKSIMDNYCKWLFDILFELESKIDLSEYNEYEARIYGFISERLLNVWLMKNKDTLKIKEKYVYNEADTYFSFLKHEIANNCRRIIYGK